MAEKIKLNFLGTGSSVPTARRNHTANLLQYKDEVILFDCGEGTQRQFRLAGISASKITKIILSHWHGDHVLGLAGLLQTMSMNGYSKSLEIYGPKGISEKIRVLFDLFGIKGEDFNLKVKEIGDGIFFETQDFYLESMKMEHNAPTNAYSFVVKEKTRIDKKKLEKLKIPNSPLIGELVKGKKVKINGKEVDGAKMLYMESSRKVTIIVDSRKCDNAVLLSNGAGLLICESSFSAEESEIAIDHGHMTSKDACEIAKEANVKKLFLIHLSQRYDVIPKKILGEAKGFLKGTKIEVKIPEDLDSLEI